jgi:uncharacterized protein (DUF488 family)
VVNKGLNQSAECWVLSAGCKDTGTRPRAQGARPKGRGEVDKIIPVEKNIFTLGTSNRSWEEFIHLLRAHGIEMVIDVRSFPTSKFDHFKRESMNPSLAEAGLGYYFLGKELGGYRKGGYEAYTRTLEYLVGLELLERMASRCRSAFVCAERLPWRCHRRFIGRSLKERGWEVTHIIDEKRVWEDRLPGEKGEEE